MNYPFQTLSICLALSSAQAQISYPWHSADATHRAVCRIDAAQALRDPAVTIPASVCGAPGSTAFVDADAPDKPLPVFYCGTNGASLLLPGGASPDKPRYVIAYRGGATTSPILTEPPNFTGDYARTSLGYTWDFEDGTQCGITSWGDRPSHIGPVTVKAGWLQIPVRDTDPYLIFGNMFGPTNHPSNLHIDSRRYRFLELRVRQSCPRAEWAFYVTDRDGKYQSLAFDVRGSDAQTFRFDLKSAFPDFWDGREFHALRIDTTNDRRDLLAELDYVRLLPDPPAVTAGPLLSRENVLARAKVTRLTASFPRTLTAGERAAAKVKAHGLPRSSALSWALVTAERGAALIEGTAASLPLPALTRAGEYAWTLGLADDLGQPLCAASGKIRVEPAALASFRLTPAKTYIDLASPSITLSVQGLDAFGNTLPADIKRPRWSLTGKAQAPDGRINGNPATVTLNCPSDTPATYRIALSDDKGHTGETSVTTVAYRKDSIRLNANGYLVDSSGTPFFPTGGLYANWPHRVSADGSIGTALDLFPCGPSRYKADFPWSPEIEAAVASYLKHCSEHGINCLRLMLRNMDLVGQVDPVQLKATLHLFDLARPHGIRFNVALMEDYDKPPYVSAEILEKIVLPHYTPAQLTGLPPHRARFLVKRETLATPALRYSDRDAIACQKDYLRELIPVLAAREEVLCYEFENEMVFPPMAWCREIAAFIRTLDPHTLILGNPGPHDWPEPLRWRDSGCDLFSYHPYNDGEAPADHGAVIYLRSKFAAQSRLPMYTGEGGLNQNRWQSEIKKIAPEPAARGTRDQIWMSVCCGANGCLYWTFMHELEAEEFAKVRTAFDALGIDLATLKRQRPSVALLLPPQQRDSRDAAVALCLLDQGVDFDTAAADEASAYAVRIDLEKTAPADLALPATVAAPAKGWQIATLLSEKNDRALLYLRNVAGGIKDFGAPPRPCLLRDVQPSEAAFTLRTTWRTITVFDLDARQARTVTPDSNGHVALGATTHDFLIGLRK